MSDLAAPPEAQARTPGSALRWTALLAVLGLGVLTRLHALGAESLWFDEAITFLRARSPIPELISSSVYKMHVPTYFLLMRQVLPFGDDEWMLRFPSALFGMLKIPVVAATGWIVGGAPVGLTAALLLVLSPAHLRYDQEARMYAMQTFALSLALLGQVWLTCHPRLAVDCWRRVNAAWQPDADARAGARAGKLAWTAWVSGTVLALYLHNTSALFLLASSCAALALLVADPVHRWRFFWHWTVANAVVLLAWSPWLPSLLSQLTRPHFASQVWGSPPRLGALTGQLRRLLLCGRSVPVNLTVLGLLIAGAWQLRRRPALLATLLLLALLAPVLLFCVSLLAKPMFMPRLMLWGVPPACVLAGCGMLAIRRRWLQMLVPVVLATFGLWQLQRGYARENKVDWRGVAQVLSKHEGRRVVVLASSFMQMTPLEYYAKRTTARVKLPRMVEVRHTHSGRELQHVLGRARSVLFVHPSGLPRENWPAAIGAIERRARRVAGVQLHGASVEHYELDETRGD
jgi:mannosyltransferase